MKFGQLIEYNRKKIFLKNHTQNVMEKLFSHPSLKNQNWVYLWIDSIKFHSVCISCMPSWELSNILKLSCRWLAFFSYKDFLENKKAPGTSLDLLSSASEKTKLFVNNFSNNFILTTQVSLYLFSFPKVCYNCIFL